MVFWCTLGAPIRGFATAQYERPIVILPHHENTFRGGTRLVVLFCSTEHIGNDSTCRCAIARSSACHTTCVACLGRERFDGDAVAAIEDERDDREA